MCKKKRFFMFRFLSFSLALWLFALSSIGSYASTTSSGSETNLFKDTYTYVRDNLTGICRYVVRWNAVISDTIIGTWSDFVDWLDSSGNGDIWEQHPHSPYRIENGYENVEVPQEVLNVVNQYVIYRINQTSPGYKEASITSYKMMNTAVFDYYALYANLQEFMSKRNGYFICSAGIEGNGSIRYNKVRVNYIPRDVNFGLVGNVIGGSFSNVQMSVNWTLGNQPQNYDSKIERWEITVGGTRQVTGNEWWFSCNTIVNTATIGRDTSNGQVIFTSLPKNEYVYVFNNNNAYKAYNSGAPQPYYLTSDGVATSMSNWSVGSGTINTGTLTNANRTYDDVISNVYNGMSVDDVIKLVDKISAKSNNVDVDIGGDDDDDDSSLWKKIGNAIGNLIDGIVDVIASVIEKLTDAVLSVIHLLTGYTDDGGVYHEGLLGKLTSLISVDFNNFLGSVFDWLPPEIVTLFTATLIFAVFFAIWKMIRG